MSDSFHEIANSDCRSISPLILVVVEQNQDYIARRVRTIRGTLSQSRIVIISPKNTPNDVLIALEAGANGYLSEEINGQALIASIELVMHGETVLPPGFVVHLQRLGVLQEIPVPSERNELKVVDGDKEKTSNAEKVPVKASIQLSVREEEIAKILTNGDSNKVIAQRLQIAETTVRVHIKSILRKIRVKNRTQAAIWAIKHLDPSPPPHKR